MLKCLFVCSMSILLVAINPRALGGENMIGGQSQNEGMLVVPAEGDVSIDGSLDDWDLSGAIWVFAEKSLRGRFSAKVAAMWDEEALYLSVHWKDPTPMRNVIDPSFDPEEGWRSDALQLRIRSSDQTSWMTTWYYTKAKQPVLHHAIWNDRDSERKGGKTINLYTATQGNDLGGGIQLAYRQDEDQRGYVQEMKLPWSLIYATPPKAQSGQDIKLGMEFVWGNPAGSAPAHRVADNVQPGVTKRQFFWSSYDSWGDASLVAEGDVEPRRYVSDEAKADGPVPLRLTLPAGATTFSLAIDDAQGKRVRNFGGLEVADYVVERSGDKVVVELGWDALTDPIGRPTEQGVKQDFVKPGDYQVRGLTHNGLGVSYDMAFYNPGTPPWQTADGSGAWGADHNSPQNVVKSGDRVVISWEFAEGGDGIIVVGADGRKKWGEKRGGRYLAADDTYVYAVPAGWHITNEVVVRFKAEDGAYAPFELDGQKHPFELATREIFDGDAPGKVAAIAAADGRLFLAMSEGEVAVLDRDSAEVQRRVKTPPLSAITVSSDGSLYGVTRSADAKLVAVDLDAKSVKPIEASELSRPIGIAIDGDGNVLTFDAGPDQQVKAFSAKGELVYTCGKKGGRPIRGAFDAQAMSHVSSVAVDASGQIWVTEHWEYPRRVSVWNREGELVRDYIGNTGYAGTGAFMHDSDPDLAYVGPIEIELDRDKREWRVREILWVPDESKGERFPISAVDHANAERFRSNASGQEREYLYDPPYRDILGHRLYAEFDDGWRPVAAVTTVSQISGSVSYKDGITRMPEGEWSDLDPYDVVFWADRNSDGIPQRSESQIVKTDRPGRKVGGKGKPAVELYGGWGGSIDQKTFTFYSRGVKAFAPEGFTDEGAPIWTPGSMKSLPLKAEGDVLPVADENKIVLLSMTGGSGLRGIDLETNQELWRYPNLYPGVHGSHKATMPEPGLLIGPLKISGYAKANDDVGNVLHLRGNLGQDFLITTDGIYVGSLFQDVRLPRESLPDDEAQLDGVPMETYSVGGEPFNGWFGTHDDGVTRLITGISREAGMLMRVNGLDQIRRIEPVTVAVSEQQIKTAREQRDDKPGGPSPAKYTIARVPDDFTVDGKPGDWDDVASMSLDRSGGESVGTVKLAYDSDRLYALYEIVDPTPWQNEGRDLKRLFKTGDTVDLQLSASRETPDRPGADEVRLLIAPVKGKPVAIIMKPVDASASDDAKKTYTSPVHSFTFDRVEPVQDVESAASTTEKGYVVEFSVSWSDLGLKPGGTIRGDVGVTGSDATGQTTVSRTYWFNRQTNLVNDEPAEAWLYPKLWGPLEFAE